MGSGGVGGLFECPMHPRLCRTYRRPVLPGMLRTVWEMVHFFNMSFLHVAVCFTHGRYMFIPSVIFNLEMVEL